MMKRFSGVLAALVLVLAVAACGDDEGSGGETSSATDPGATSRTHSPQPTDASGARCTYVQTTSPSKAVEPPAQTAAYNGTVEATLSTNVGDIDLTLDAAAAPCTVNSFTSLASQAYFDDTTCHRLTTSGIFVLQCGDPDGTGAGGPGYSFADELSGAETYPAGTLAMANAGPNTNGSQFFLVYEDSQLPAAYTVFGEVSADGLEVLRSIAEKGTADGGGDGAPAEPVDIDFAEIGDSTPGDPAQPTSPATEASCTYSEDGSGSADVPPSEPTETTDVAARIRTSVGVIPVTLDAASAPCTVNSFLSLADQGFFDTTTCHRLTTAGLRVLQCGDPTGTGAGGPGYSFADELDGTETYGKGTLAMANAGPNTNGSQFFMVYGDSQLPPAYTVFGSIAPAGLKVLSKVAAAGVKGGGGDGPPKTTVRISGVTVG
ncbi:MAG: peptidylprolyl isomerase [Nocardioides sp.]|uniref:peptidylprolyl isomerase n=1 Tax=Nocardioides sp. TaxID=35761 RepID=UPI002387403D|nr:peptidylprolyl isomerase [Nocardioides sp.]MDE0778344.1 peptidylprolyl isomerase [Nocardioides sp.]